MNVDEVRTDFSEEGWGRASEMGCDSSQTFQASHVLPPGDSTSRIWQAMMIDIQPIEMETEDSLHLTRNFKISKLRDTSPGHLLTVEAIFGLICKRLYRTIVNIRPAGVHEEEWLF